MAKAKKPAKKAATKKQVIVKSPGKSTKAKSQVIDSKNSPRETKKFDVDSLISSATDGVETKTDIDQEQVAGLLDKYGLRWNVAKRELRQNSGGIDKPSGFYGIVRTDTDKCFMATKGGYEIFQNSHLAELVIRIADKAGYQMHSGGSFDGGSRVYLQLNTGNELKNLGQNRTTVQGFVTGINSHDGSTSLKWGAVDFTVCCRNTFAMANGALQESARHGKNIHTVVDQSIKKILGISDQQEKIFGEYRRLAEIGVTKQAIAQVVKTVTFVDINMTDQQKKDAKISGYAKNRTEELLNSISSEMNYKGETLWGLFSGVTNYTSHVMPVSKNDNARIQSLYTGEARSINNDAYIDCLEIAGIEL